MSVISDARPPIAGSCELDAAGCWLWTGYCDRNGYARTYYNGQTDWAHRVSFRIHNGPIPYRHEIDHTCQVTRCVNPSHLEVVTRVEHVARTYRRLGKDNRHLWAAELRQQALTYAEIAAVIGMAGRGTAYSAVESALAKGLVAPDDVPPARRLSSTERADIIDLHTAWGVPQTALAEWYGVDSSHISRICAGQTSGHTRRAAS
jgi:hypothetical protein